MGAPRHPGHWWDLSKPPPALAGPLLGLWRITHLRVVERQATWSQEASWLTLAETCQATACGLILLWVPFI